MYSRIVTSMNNSDLELRVFFLMEIYISSASLFSNTRIFVFKDPGSKRNTALYSLLCFFPHYVDKRIMK